MGRREACRPGAACAIHEENSGVLRIWRYYGIAFSLVLPGEVKELIFKRLSRTSGHFLVLLEGLAPERAREQRRGSVTFINLDEITGPKDEVD